MKRESQSGTITEKEKNKIKWGTYTVFIQEREFGNGLKPWDHRLKFSTFLSQTRNCIKYFVFKKKRFFFFFFFLHQEKYVHQFIIAWHEIQAEWKNQKPAMASQLLPKRKQNEPGLQVRQ